MMAMDILGFELSDEQRTELEKAEEEKKKLAEEIAKRPIMEKPKEEDEQAEQEPKEESESAQMKGVTFQTELDKWRRKAINAMKKGKPANVTFDTTVIPSEMCETIMTALGNAQSESDVRDAFNVTSTPEPQYESGIIALTNELKRANDLLEKSIEPTTGTE